MDEDASNSGQGPSDTVWIGVWHSFYLEFMPILDKMPFKRRALHGFAVRKSWEPFASHLCFMRARARRQLEDFMNNVPLL